MVGDSGVAIQISGINYVVVRADKLMPDPADEPGTAEAQSGTVRSGKKTISGP